MCCKASLESCGRRRVGSVVMRNSIHYTENFKGKFGLLEMGFVCYRKMLLMVYLKLCFSFVM